MSIWVFSHCRNEAAMLPFYLRHYAQFADKIHVYDDDSDDGSRDIIRSCPKAVLHEIKTGGLDERAMLELAYAEYPKALGRAEWVMWPDIDEFIYHPFINDALNTAFIAGFDVVRPLGFNMLGAPLPRDDGRSQLTDIYRTGIRAEVYSKPIIWRPLQRMRWAAGKHKLAEAVPTYPIGDPKLSDPSRVKLLHYRYLTADYCRARNARQLARSTDKGAAWSCSPEYNGEHSPSWVDRVTPHAYDVVDDGAAYRDTPETRELHPCY